MILKATRELIAEVGFRGVRSRLVAEKAGISEGTIYRYFPTMTALYAEVFRTAALRELAASFKRAWAPSLDNAWKHSQRSRTDKGHGLSIE